jgi:hypothetical protein
MHLSTLQLARSYVDAINSGGMPSIADAWEAAASAQCGRALATAWDAYGAVMREAAVLPMDESTLQAAHDLALDRAVRIFDGAVPSGADVAVEKNRGKLKSLSVESFSGLKVGIRWLEAFYEHM